MSNPSSSVCLNGPISTSRINSFCTQTRSSVTSTCNVTIVLGGIRGSKLPAETNHGLPIHAHTHKTWLQTSPCLQTYVNTETGRGRQQHVKSGSTPNKWGWPDSPQSNSNPLNANNPLWPAKCFLRAQTSPHITHFHPQPACNTPFSATVSYFSLQHQHLIKSTHNHSLSSTHHHSNTHSLP